MRQQKKTRVVWKYLSRGQQRLQDHHGLHRGSGSLQLLAEPGRHFRQPFLDWRVGTRHQLQRAGLLLSFALRLRLPRVL